MPLRNKIKNLTTYKICRNLFITFNAPHPYNLSHSYAAQRVFLMLRATDSINSCYTIINFVDIFIISLITLLGTENIFDTIINSIN